LAVAKRAIASEQQRSMALMPTLVEHRFGRAVHRSVRHCLGHPMDAFLRIGVEKSASLPVVAPAIGEALIATAFGLIAARFQRLSASTTFDKRIGESARRAVRLG